MRTLVLASSMIGSFLFGLFLLTSQASADVPDVNWELNRQQGFDEQQKENAEFNKERLSGLSEAKKNREDWDKKQAGAVHDYKIWKEHEGHTPDENSPEYREDQKERMAAKAEHEKARLRYENLESQRRQQLKRVHPLRECREFQVCDYQLGDKQFEALRVPQKDRLLYGNKPNYLEHGVTASSGGSSSGRSDTDSFSRGAGDFISPPPPATPNGPEFYEPDVPPPPPPPMPEGGGFDDTVPPPIFDDPGY